MKKWSVTHHPSWVKIWALHIATEEVPSCYLTVSGHLCIRRCRHSLVVSVFVYVLRSIKFTAPLWEWGQQHSYVSVHSQGDPCLAQYHAKPSLPVTALPGFSLTLQYALQGDSSCFSYRDAVVCSKICSYSPFPLPQVAPSFWGKPTFTDLRIFPILANRWDLGRGAGVLVLSHHPVMFLSSKQITAASSTASAPVRRIWLKSNPTLQRAIWCWKWE